MPRLLPCTHTYCHKCLTRYSKEGKPVLLPGCSIEVHCIECPRGCGSTPVGSNGAAALPANTVLISRLDKEYETQDVPMCEECDGQGVPADFWCDNCDAYFCKAHFNSMHATKIGRRHRTLRASEHPRNKSSTRCAHHAGQEIVLYCRTHNEPVCRDCCSVPFGGQHAQCTVVPLATASEETASLIRETMGTMRGQLLGSLQEAACEVQVQLAAVDTLSWTAERDLERAFHNAETAIVASLREKRDELMSKSADRAKAHRTVLASQAAEIGTAAAGLITVCGETEAELRAGSTAVLHRSHQLLEQLDKVAAESKKCQLVPLATARPAMQLPPSELASILCKSVDDYAAGVAE
eukprot:TRINITY_DN27483_c0_g1_i1.p1 TRINITY_DN27483_c0_g1~~TRINITY_DN27483_c0_g1_i1.p1  ORF type:complete len:406 (+),score=103.13 TRINITY_DN27483_c0_g1_i1:164-1219(+)